MKAARPGGGDDPKSPDDLMSLEDFTDETLLHALWSRYEKKNIYTWVGSVLVSVNPYRDVGVFREDVVQQYASSSPPKAPHLFATVQAALAAPGDRHALLITGESGAGKTEATRAVLSFLAMRRTCGSFIRDRLLRSTPVLEAFGNAHTRQNTNSSRFGKFIEVHLNGAGEVSGATLQPYMLEASRVAGNLPQGERTYHVFYLLRAALAAVVSGNAPQGALWQRLAAVPEWGELARIGASALSSSRRLCDGPADARCAKWFEVLVEGLIGSGLSLKEVVDCCRVVTAVALLVDADGESQNLAGAAKLLRMSESDLAEFFAKAEMSVGAGGREQLVRERGAAEAATLRASLAQELYGALFGWLTRLVARGIAPQNKATEKGSCQLGLLDLYGFEVFSLNGFEQLLINYCNERLQQLFNRQVFACEAQEYIAEGIDADGRMARLTAACSLPALSLLEGEQGSGKLGIFGIVNDRSRCSFEESTREGDKGSCPLTDAVTKSCAGHKAFSVAGRGACTAFGVKHFAGEVMYEAAKFVRKNASAHRPDIVAFLRSRGCNFVREVLGTEGEGGVSSGGGARPRGKLFGKTLISSFQQELNELCSTLEARECRHVRCLRPNDSQQPLVFDDASMLRQCRYSGLLEATRIRRQGFPHRRTLESFAAAYADLLGSRQAARAVRSGSLQSADVLSACEVICDVARTQGDISQEDMHIGHTKVFLRQPALQWFETMRRHAAATSICALVRCWAVRRRLQHIHDGAVIIQCFARRRAARRRYLQLRAEAQAALAEQARRLEEERRRLAREQSQREEQLAMQRAVAQAEREEAERRLRAAREQADAEEAERRRLQAAQERADAEAAKAAAATEAAQTARRDAGAERKAAAEAYMHLMERRAVIAARQEAARQLESQMQSTASSAGKSQEPGTEPAQQQQESTQTAASSTVQRWWRARPARRRSAARKLGKDRGDESCFFDCLCEDQADAARAGKGPRGQCDKGQKASADKTERAERDAAPARLMRIATPARATAARASRKGAPPPTYAAADINKRGAPPPTYAAANVNKKGHSATVPAAWELDDKEEPSRGSRETASTVVRAKVLSSGLRGLPTPTVTSSSGGAGSRAAARSSAGAVPHAAVLASKPARGGGGWVSDAELRVAHRIDPAARAWSERPHARAGGAHSPPRPVGTVGVRQYSPGGCTVVRVRSPVVVRGTIGSTASLRAVSFTPRVYPTSPTPGSSTPQTTYGLNKKPVTMMSANGGVAGSRSATSVPVVKAPTSHLAASTGHFFRQARSPTRTALRVSTVSPGPVPRAGSWVRVTSPLATRVAPPVARLASPVPSFSGAGTPNAGGGVRSGRSTPGVGPMAAPPWLLAAAGWPAPPGSPLAGGQVAKAHAVQRCASPVAAGCATSAKAGSLGCTVSTATASLQGIHSPATFNSHLTEHFFIGSVPPSGAHSMALDSGRGCSLQVEAADIGGMQEL